MATDTASPLRQRMIEDMNSRRLCAHSQRGHIHPLAVNHRRFRKIPGIVIFAVVSSITSRDALPETTLAEHPINSVREIRAALRRCWVPPPTRIAQLTVRLSLKRNGEFLGQPLISYTSPDNSEDERAALHAAVVGAIAGCSPLPISNALGEIIAGRPINVRLGEGWTKRTDTSGRTRP
jgi:hypothetical protein